MDNFSIRLPSIRIGIVRGGFIEAGIVQALDEDETEDQAESDEDPFQDLD